MSNNYDYMKLPYDVSGSMAKNRFRNEVLWGLKKIFDLHKEKKDYVVVFDYVCDIEVHLKSENKYEFYQVKTNKKDANYKLATLTRLKNGNSILGKLYVLKYCSKGHEKKSVKLGIVSNIPLSDGKDIYDKLEEFDFNDLKDDKKKEVIEKLEKELTKNVSLNNLFFVRTGMDLIHPHMTLIGETASFFKEYYSEEPKKINTLYNVLASELEQKACYELETKDYFDLIKKKAFSRDEIENILEKYVDKIDISVEKTKNYIVEKYKDNFIEKMNFLEKLSKLIINLKNNEMLKDKENKIANYIFENITSLGKTEEEVICTLCEEFSIIGFDDKDLKVFIILILKRLEENIYE